MEKGQHGYMNRHKRNVLISIIVLGLFVIAGVFFTVVMFDTRKSIFIVIPILVALPLAKQLVAYIMCAGFMKSTQNLRSYLTLRIHPLCMMFLSADMRE